MLRTEYSLVTLLYPWHPLESTIHYLGNSAECINELFQIGVPELTPAGLILAEVEGISKSQMSSNGPVFCVSCRLRLKEGTHIPQWASHWMAHYVACLAFPPLVTGSLLTKVGGLLRVGGENSRPPSDGSEMRPWWPRVVYTMFPACKITPFYTEKFQGLCRLALVNDVLQVIRPCWD